MKTSHSIRFFSPPYCYFNDDEVVTQREGRGRWEEVRCYVWRVEIGGKANKSCLETGFKIIVMFNTFELKKTL